MDRNDPRQYEALAEQWWRPEGAFAMLHWLAAARAALVPPGDGTGVLVDLGCGGGLGGPHVSGYRQVGIDIGQSNVRIAARHGLTPIRADVHSVPLRDGCADVVLAGEILEHLSDWRSGLAEACRVLRPGGTLIIDTLNATAASRLIAVRLAERIPGTPSGIHDPALFVPRRELVAECARHGVTIRVWGIRPGFVGLVRWLFRRTARPVPIVRTAVTSVLYAGRGIKNARGT